MADILDDLRKVARLNGDTYSSAEVLGMVGRSADEIEQLRGGLEAAIRAARLALFVINKAGVMPNSSWESGFKSDLAKATYAIATTGKQTP